MDITRKQLTNAQVPGQSLMHSPMNSFANIPAYPPAEDKTVVRTNYDTLYSVGYLDLTKEPMVLSVPDTNGRYYLLPMLDMWTDVFASPGWRTTGTRDGHFLVTAPGWRPDLRERLVDDLKLPKDIQRIDAPTPYVWIIGRTKTDGPRDYEAVHKIQAGYKITPLTQWGKTAEPPVARFDPSVDMKTPPKTQVDTMQAGRFFSYAAEITKLQPPHITDEPIVAQLKKIGFEPGKNFDIANLDPMIARALNSVPDDAQRLMDWKLPTIARSVNNWSMNTDTMGVYGNYYLKRAIVARIGLGANLPEDAIYPLTFNDEAGKPLDGKAKYVIHFDKGATPPARGFWSITLYDADGFAYPNSLNRQSLSSWMPLKFNSDGSLDLYFQNEDPGPAQQANWLPAPKAPFNLTMRLYAPTMDALTGKWNPPPVTQEQTVRSIAQ
jgi:hypothetical protein